MVTLTLTNREYADLKDALSGQIARLEHVTKRKSKPLGRLRRLRGAKFRKKVVRCA